MEARGSSTKVWKNGRLQDAGGDAGLENTGAGVAFLPVDLHLGGGEHLLDGRDDFGADSVAGN